MVELEANNDMGNSFPLSHRPRYGGTGRGHHTKVEPREESLADRVVPEEGCLGDQAELAGAGHRFAAAGRAELAQDVAEMLLHRLQRDHRARRRSPCSGVPAATNAEHLQLPAWSGVRPARRAADGLLRGGPPRAGTRATTRFTWLRAASEDTPGRAPSDARRTRLRRRAAIEARPRRRRPERSRSGRARASASANSGERTFVIAQPRASPATRSARISDQALGPPLGVGKRIQTLQQPSTAPDRSCRASSTRTSTR